ncbi:cytochrome P450 [Artemisia annua]|uniref:Cytochrome P450 n=1 Tax=Artemisia annua TaxID=35608 RepID=A0A2U1LU30_ARTAN|nr:cytochrome P450 [Artemisia annua]
MTDLAEKYKTYRVTSLFHADVYTSDPANVEYILKTNFENYGKDLFMKATTDSIFRVGFGIELHNMNGSNEEGVKFSRAFDDANALTFRRYIDISWKIKKFLNIGYEAKLKKNMKVIDEFIYMVIQIKIAQMQKSKDDSLDLFMKATTDSIFRVGFGIELDNMNGSNEEGVKFSRAFDDANALTFRRYIDISWKIKKFLNIGYEAKLKKNMKVIDEFIYMVIQIKIAQMQKSKDDSLLKKEDILSRFVQINDNDPKYLRDVILNFVLAGKDPIAITMCWFIYELCKRPEVQDKVAKEIREAINMNEEITNVAEFAARVSEATLEKMQYLHAALTETIRLYPALPVDPKICFSDDVLPDGCSVKKGDVVAFTPYAMGKMKFIWGDDAHEFKPERWIDHNGRFRTESPYKFTAFQAGPRTCLGRDFAYRQLKIFASVLLGCFMFKLSDENNVPRYRISINLHIDDPLQICVFKRPGLHNP